MNLFSHDPNLKDSKKTKTEKNILNLSFGDEENDESKNKNKSKKVLKSKTKK